MTKPRDRTVRTAGTAHGLTAATASLAAAATLLGALAAAAPADSAFTAGFSTAVSASGEVDIAQPEGQFAAPDAPSALSSNGRAVAPAGADGSPGAATAVVSFPVISRSSAAAVEISVALEEVEPDEILEHLRIAAQAEGGTPVPDGTTVSGSWFAAHPEGLVLLRGLEPDEETELSLSFWLAADAPASARNAGLDVLIRVSGETQAPVEPVRIEGAWA
jgi:hypothetical protein